MLHLLMLSLLSVGTIAALSARSTGDTPKSSWYLDNRPFFAPRQGWVFALAWSILYSLLTFVLFKLMQKYPDQRNVLILLTVNLLLNVAWCHAFFSTKETVIALIIIVNMVWLTMVKIHMLWSTDRMLAYSLIPYGVWITYATTLNAGFVRNLSERTCW